MFADKIQEMVCEMALFLATFIDETFLDKWLPNEC